MPEAQCIKYPIKPGRRETLVNWIARLEDRSEELLEAMAEGGLQAEAVFLEHSVEGDYLLIYTSAPDLKAGMEALARSRLPLNREFDQLMVENLETDKAVSLDLVYHTP
jgi:Family of unknown function (DUF6176)